MLGAIIGDIVGSVYEGNNIKTKHFRLFKDKCFFTDDTVMTIAVAEALLKGGSSGDFVSSMKKFGRAFPNVKYGWHFRSWLLSEGPEPYGSFGNGAAMRVSPIAWRYNTLEQVEAAAEASAAVTHDHPEGIKGAKATAAAGFIVRSRDAYKILQDENGSWGMHYVYDKRAIDRKKEEMKEYIEKTYGYNLSQSLAEVRPSYRFDVSCYGTIPPAMIAFLESVDFEDAIRNAISLGGDSDTLAAITGGIAEAAYGIPEGIEKQALAYLPEKLRSAVAIWRLELEAAERLGSFHTEPDLDFLAD